MAAHVAVGDDALQHAVFNEDRHAKRLFGHGDGIGRCGRRLYRARLNVLLCLWFHGLVSKTRTAGVQKVGEGSLSLVGEPVQRAERSIKIPSLGTTGQTVEG